MADPPTPTTVDVIMKDYPRPKPSGKELPDFMLSDDPQFDRLKEYARNLPYPIESNAHMQELLDFILKRRVESYASSRLLLIDFATGWCSV